MIRTAQLNQVVSYILEFQKTLEQNDSKLLKGAIILILPLI